MKNVFGGLMMGCGILIAGLTGLCLLISALTFLPGANPTPANQMIGLIPSFLAGFGVPFAIGIGLFFGGKALMNSSTPAPAEPLVPPEEVRPAAPPEVGNPNHE